MCLGKHRNIKQALEQPLLPHSRWRMLTMGHLISPAAKGRLLLGSQQKSGREEMRYGKGGQQGILSPSAYRACVCLSQLLHQPVHSHLSSLRHRENDAS